MVKWAQRALVKPTATPSVLPARAGLGSVLCPSVSLATPFLVSRFSFAHTCSSSSAFHHREPGRAPICHLPTTVPLHGSRSLAASLPCRATACLCLWSSERLYLTSLPALPASDCLLPPPTPTRCCCCCSSSYLHYYLPPLRYLFCLRQTLPAYPLTSTNPPIHQSSQPASQPASHIPDSRVGCPHPIHRIRPRLSASYRTLAHSLPCLLYLPSLAFYPWRPPGLSSSFAWHTAASHSMRSW